MTGGWENRHLFIAWILCLPSQIVRTNVRRSFPGEWITVLSQALATAEMSGIVWVSVLHFGVDVLYSQKFFQLLKFKEEEMNVRETIAQGRGIMTVTQWGGTLIVTATIAGEGAAAVTAVAAAAAGAKIASVSVTERGKEKETEITVGAILRAELVPEAGVRIW